MKKKKVKKVINTQRKKILTILGNDSFLNSAEHHREKLLNQTELITYRNMLLLLEKIEAKLKLKS
jgi:hypothetical protein